MSSSKSVRSEFTLFKTSEKFIDSSLSNLAASESKPLSNLVNNAAVAKHYILVVNRTEPSNELDSLWFNRNSAEISLKKSDYFIFQNFSIYLKYGNFLT